MVAVFSASLGRICCDDLATCVFPSSPDSVPNETSVIICKHCYV